MFAQHHQLPCVTLKRFFTAILFSINIFLFNKSFNPLSSLFESQIPIQEIVMRVKPSNLALSPTESVLRLPDPMRRVASRCEVP